MSSMIRRIQRRAAVYREEGKPWPYRPLPDGGYEALHPTRGWKRISGARLRAQGAMAEIVLEARKKAAERMTDLGAITGWSAFAA